MKILILEDNDKRIEIFKRKLKNHQLYICKDITKAKKIVKQNNDIELYFLDHDLGGEVYVDSLEENTGYRFAEFLVANNIHANFITHTLNPIGARNICGILYGCKYIPFCNLFDDIDDSYQ